MTGLSLHKQRRAAHHRSRYLPTRGCWNEPTTICLSKGAAMVSLGLLLSIGVVPLSLLVGPGASILLTLFASALFFPGSIILLFALGQKLAHRLRSIKKHCGTCRFYQAPGAFYVVGRCQADPSRQVVFRTDTCPSFSFSERAMVRDRLAQRPDLLKQIQITHTSDSKAFGQ